VRAPDVGHLLFSHESRNPVCVQLHSICTVSWITQFQGTHRRMRELNRNYVEFGFVVILLQTSLFLRRGVQISFRRQTGRRKLRDMPSGLA